MTALAFNVGLNFLLVPRYGIVVAAVVTVASEVLILAGSYCADAALLRLLPAAAHAAAARWSPRRAMGGLLWLLGDAAAGRCSCRWALRCTAGLLWLLSPASRELVTGCAR